MKKKKQKKSPQHKEHQKQETQANPNWEQENQKFGKKKNRSNY